MKIHRFYSGDNKLTDDLWLKNQALIHQWSKVLRFKPGQQLVLFDSQSKNRLYELIDLAPTEAHLKHITDFEPKLPAKNIYLFWSLLTKDKNDWVLQKCTELGVSHFVPLLAERSTKTGFNIERAQRIVIEAAEQCGRSDIPSLREPIHVATAIEQYGDKITLVICEQDSDELVTSAKAVGILIGPEGGWSDTEKQLFTDANLAHLNLHNFTLRAETAAVTAAVKLIQ